MGSFKLTRLGHTAAGIFGGVLFSLLGACDSYDSGAALGPEGDSTSAQSGGPRQPNTNLVFAPAAALAAAPNASSTFSELNIAQQALSLEDLQAQIFQPMCAGCHVGGGDKLPESLNLSSATDTYANTIGSASTEDPRYDLVEPGESTHSYLVRKIEGTQSVGQQMPLQGGPLPDWMVTAVKRWIDSGAVY